MRYYVAKIKENAKKLGQSGFIHILVGNTLLKFMSMLSSIFIARLITKEEMALVSYVDNIFSYFLIVAGLGTAGSILRYCSLAKKENIEIAYFKFGAKFGLIIEFIITFIIIIIANVGEFPFANIKEYILLYSLFPILNFIYEYVATFLRVELQFKKYSAVVVTYSCVLTGLIILLTYNCGIIGVYISRYIAVITAMLISVVFVRKIINNKKSLDYESYRLDFSEKKEFVSYSFASVCSTSLSIVIPLNEIFLVNNLIQNEVVSANYKVAVTIPQVLAFVTSSIMMFAIPYFVKHEKDKKWISKYSKLLQVGLAIFFVCASLMYVFLSKPIIGIIFGEKYIEVAGLSSMLFIAHSINAGFRMIPLNILLALGYAKFNAYMALASVIFTAIIDYLLITVIGINGVAFGIMFVYIVSGMISWFFLIKKVIWEGGK